MIDPITAFAIAKAAIAGVQEAIQMGKDLHECSGDLIKFFEHRDIVATDDVAHKGKKPVSEMGQAISSVSSIFILRQAQADLKRSLIYSGQGDKWEAILAEYNRLVAERKRAEREAEAVKKHKREQLAELVEVLFYGFCGCIAGGLICWGTLEFIIYKMRL